MKRIITCSDGTWNKPGDEYKGKPIRTNVQKIFEAICKKTDDDVHQVKYYDEGVGSEGTAWSKIIGGATGKGIDENILDAYKFIAWNYEPGDELFIFGFSRGAYTARSLAGLIRNCGILMNNDLKLFDKAYEIYRDRGNPERDPNGSESKAFRDKYSHPLENIKFIGVWDTVGSLGVPLRWFQWYNKGKYAFHDTTLSSYVEHAYQALAVDEKRSNFQPTLWQKSACVKDGSCVQTMEQAWFAGVHCNIGGGYPDERLSDIPLQWLIGKAKSVGLGFDENYIKDNVAAAAEGELYDSKTGIFKLAGSYLRPVKKTADANEDINITVFERIALKNGYDPDNIKGIMA